MGDANSAPLGAALLAIGLYLATGLGIGCFLPALRGAGFLQRAGLGYLLGLAWIGLLLYAASHFAGLPLSAPLIWAVAAPPIAGGAIAASRHRGRPSRRVDRRGRRPLLALGWVALFLVGAAVSLAALASALTHPITDFDGRMTWSAQARFVRAAGTVDAPALAVRRAYITHPRYPLLMPLCQIAALEVARSEDERVIRPLYAAVLPALMALIASLARRWAGSRAALAATFALITIPFLPFAPDGGALSAYSDLPLAGFIGGGLLLLLRGRPRLMDGLGGGLLLAAATLTKNEGVIESLVVLGVVAGMAIGARRRRARNAPARAGATAAAAAVVGLAIVLLLSWRSSIPNRNDEAYAEKASLGALVAHLASTHAFRALPEICRQSFLPLVWGLFWWLAPVALALGAARLARPPAPALAIVAIVPLLLAWAAYSWVADPVGYARVTWDRLVAQATAPGSLLLALALRRALSYPGNALRRQPRTDRPEAAP